MTEQDVPKCWLCGSTRSNMARHGPNKRWSCDDIRGCERRQYPPTKYTHADARYNTHPIWRSARDMFPHCHRCDTALVEIKG